MGSCVYEDVATFSFHPVKTITSGEGGAVTTNSAAISRKMRALRSHSSGKKHLDVTLGVQDEGTRLQL